MVCDCQLVTYEADRDCPHSGYEPETNQFRISGFFRLSGLLSAEQENVASLYCEWCLPFQQSHPRTLRNCVMSIRWSECNQTIDQVSRSDLCQADIPAKGGSKFHDCHRSCEALQLEVADSCSHETSAFVYMLLEGINAGAC